VKGCDFLETKAMIHSFNDYGTATIIGKYGDNKYIAQYNGQHCTAIYNPFVGCYYVDNIYGLLSPDQAKNILADYSKTNEKAAQSGPKIHPAKHKATGSRERGSR